MPLGQLQEGVVSALSKLRQHIYIFRNQRGFRTALEKQVRVSGIKPARMLTLNMPVRWSSTYDMINTAYIQEAPITAVCTTQ